MAVNIEVLSRLYFAQDLPVPFNTEIYDKEHKDKIKQLEDAVNKVQQHLINNPYNHKTLELQDNLTQQLLDEIDKYTPEMELYPILVKDYEIFMSCASCILLDKNDSIDMNNPDQMVEILQMSNLDYFIFVGKRDERTFSQFTQLLSLVLKKNVSSKNLSKTVDKFGKTILVVNDEYYLNEKDFDNLKDIIGFYNLPSYNNKFQNKDILEEIRKTNYLKMKNEEEISFEEKVTTLSCLTHMNESDIWNMSFRRFNLKFLKSNEILNYTINRIIEGGGQVKFKEPIRNYLYKRSTDFGFVDLDNFKKKVSNPAGGVTF